MGKRCIENSDKGAGMEERDRGDAHDGQRNQHGCCLPGSVREIRR